MREKNGIPARFNTYVVDDGWNLIPIPLGVGNSAYNDEMIMQCAAI